MGTKTLIKKFRKRTGQASRKLFGLLGQAVDTGLGYGAARVICSALLHAISAPD